jgi:hypothetical protein
MVPHPFAEIVPPNGGTTCSATLPLPQLGQHLDTSFPLGYQVYPQFSQTFCGRLVMVPSFKYQRFTSGR